jgi:uncharacterized protein YwqG
MASRRTASSILRSLWLNRGRVQSPSSFRRRLESSGLGRHAEKLERLARPGIRLRPHSVSDAAAGIGQSRIGGQPDLPASTEWPEYLGVPQSFIAQINLAETHGYDPGGQLPGAGILSFFYDSAQRVWGFDPSDKDGWAVLYTEASVNLAPRAFPDALPDQGRFRPVTLRPEGEITYARSELSELEAVGLDADEGSTYDELIEEVEGSIHRLLGHPNSIQGDMQLECQLVSHGLYLGNPSGYREPMAAELRPGAVDWRLLLQIDSDEAAQMMWGDSGRIYYWMHKDAMRECRWDKARLVLQCY